MKTDKERKQINHSAFPLETVEVTLQLKGNFIFLSIPTNKSALIEPKVKTFKNLIIFGLILLPSIEKITPIKENPTVPRKAKINIFIISTLL